MRLNIDIETFSSVDLDKAGMYKYVESPDFEVLLFAYSVDGSPVKVINLAQGEAIPQDIVDALYDPANTLHAWNAIFERTCLSKHFNRSIPLVMCRDTMLHAMYCGYPAKLESAGEAIGLPQDKKKLTTGRALIKLFCTPTKPTKRNSMRTRTYPRNEPEKWELFKEYNAQDVVAEMEIENALSAFPVPDEIQSQWVLDKEINQRGVRVDLELVVKALQIGAEVQEALTAEATEISGLDNPNSVQQLSKWLDKEIEADVTDLRAATVKDLLDKGVKSEAAERMLEIRQLLSKTSTKKYDAVVACACEDERVRGLLAFYGANRTGRWCLTGDHEVLTPEGWERLDTWSGGDIACWSPQTEFISFQKAKRLSFDYMGEMYAINHQRCEQLSTPDHKMPVLEKDGTWGVRTVDEIATRRVAIPFTGRRLSYPSTDANNLRVLIMVQADGHYTREGDIRLHFSKERKIERCKNLLRRCQIPFIVHVNGDKTTNVIIKSRVMPLWLRLFSNKTFGYWLLDESADVVFDELQYWDAYRCSPNSIQYVSINKQNAEVLQALASLSGRSATLLTKHREKDEWRTAYILNIWETPGQSAVIRREQFSTEIFSGKVYCAETATGFFMVRRNGKVWVTGNSGRNIQIQNLPRTYIKALDAARSVLRMGNTAAMEMLFGNVPDTLSQLIRTVFIASEGKHLVVSDFSAIEARVLAWLAQEKWVMEVFAGDGKIYEATASQMFGVPIDKVDKELRQRGKVATLACGYGGSVGAMERMDINHAIDPEQYEELVQRWRAANPRIVQFWYTVNDAAIAALKNGRPTRVNCLIFQHEHDKERDYLTVRLPSGRKLFYVAPFLTENRWGKESLGYWGQNQTTHKWEKQEIYGGKWAENCCQSIARDCLMVAIQRLEAESFNIVMHVHDEVVCDCDKTLEEANRILGLPIDWAPGLLLTGAGFTGNFYRKE